MAREVDWGREDYIIIVIDRVNESVIYLASYVQRAFCRPESAKERLKELANLVFDNRKEIVMLKLESKLTENTQKNGTHGWSTA